MQDRMAYQGRQPDQLNLLLLSGDQGWISAVRAAAAQLGVGSLAIAASPADAVRLLAEAGRPYSHLLLHPHSAGDLLPALIGLTAGDVGSGVTLVVLGPPEVLPEPLTPMHIRVVRGTEDGWLRKVLLPSEPSAANAGPLSEADLREALAASRIQARYQPIVRFSDQVPVGIEVLARLDHPTRGTLSPDLFIPAIERAGLARRLTEVIVQRAFDDWPGSALTALDFFIAVNVPLDVLLMPGTLDMFETRCEHAGIPASRILIELTESLPVTDIPALRAAIEGFRARGYGLALDDVAPDLRDYEALMGLSFTAVKLDKDLVRESPDSTMAQAFLEDAILAARAADLTIIAEGVEESEIWDRMKSLGVDQAQGYLVARPLPLGAVRPWRESWLRSRGL